MVSVAFTDVCEDGTAPCRHLSDKPHLLQIRNDTPRETTVSDQPRTADFPLVTKPSDRIYCIALRLRQRSLDCPSFLYSHARTP
ncbi:hypothetical protein J2X43_003567 [Rhizobium sp. BE258]|nr:hypothetical protein [Rhizobium sp. BE258]